MKHGHLAHPMDESVLEIQVTASEEELTLSLRKSVQDLKGVTLAIYGRNEAQPASPEPNPGENLRLSAQAATRKYCARLNMFR